jgi:hypothetical protein
MYYKKHQPYGNESLCFNPTRKFPRLKREKKSSTIGIGFHFLCCFGRWLNIIKKEEKNEEAYFLGFGG